MFIMKYTWYKLLFVNRPPTILSLYIVKGYSGITILIELKITVEYHPRKLLQAKQKSDFFPAVPKFIVANCMVKLLFFATFKSIYFLL